MRPFGQTSRAGDDRHAPCRRSVSFPLTPALSPAEREKHGPRSGEFVRVGFAVAQPRILPLPGGEGWGEGERGHLRLDA